MRIGTTRRTPRHPDGPLEHAVRGELVASRPSRRRYATHCGTIVPVLEPHHNFDAARPRACPACVSNLGLAKRGIGASA